MDDLVSGASYIMVMLGSVATAEQEKFWLKVCLILLYEFCRNFLHVGGCSNIRGYWYDVPGHISMESLLTPANKRC
jgi:hypothetical protein